MCLQESACKTSVLVFLPKQQFRLTICCDIKLKMPQKGYLANKKSLPKLSESKAAESESESDEIDNVEETSSSISPKAVVSKETFSLYVRGPAWIKNRDNALNRLKEICPKITDVRHPRQKSADYCFIDFATAADRDQSFAQLKANDELNVKSVTKDIPKLLEKRKKKVEEKREAKKETRKILAKIKKNQKLAEHPAEKTNQLIVANLPTQATAAELKEQFPDATTVNLKLKKKTKKMNSAIITFPDTYKAFSASKSTIELHGQKLNVFLNTGAMFKAQANTKRKAPLKPQQSTDVEPKKKKKKKKKGSTKVLKAN